MTIYPYTQTNRRGENGSRDVERQVEGRRWGEGEVVTLTSAFKRHPTSTATQVKGILWHP